MRISDWSSDVCSSDLAAARRMAAPDHRGAGGVGPRPSRSPVGALRGQPDRPQIERPPRSRHRDLREVEGADQIGRASCRERVCQYVSISVGAVSFTKNKTSQKKNTWTETK